MSTTFAQQPPQRSAEQVSGHASSATPSRWKFWVSATVLPLILFPIWSSFSWTFPAALDTSRGLVLILLLACTSITDLSQRKIYNWASYTALLWALTLNLLPQPISTNSIGLSASLIGATTCFGVMLVPYFLARGGAGDVKLAAAIGGLLGVGDGLLVIAFAYIVAGATIVGWTVIRKGPFVLAAALCNSIGSGLLPRIIAPANQEQQQLLQKTIPLAGFFAIASLLVVFDVPALLRTL